MDAISNLDIFSRAGPSTAHDELLPFSVSGGRLFLGDSEGDVPDGPSTAFNGKLHIEFVKVSMMSVDAYGQIMRRLRAVKEFVHSQKSLKSPLQ